MKKNTYSKKNYFNPETHSNYLSHPVWEFPEFASPEIDIEAFEYPFKISDGELYDNAIMLGMCSKYDDVDQSTTGILSNLAHHRSITTTANSLATAIAVCKVLNFVIFTKVLTVIYFEKVTLVQEEDEDVSTEEKKSFEDSTLHDALIGLTGGELTIDQARLNIKYNYILSI